MALERRSPEETAQRLAFTLAEDRMTPRAYRAWAKGQGDADPFATRADLRRFFWLQPFVAEDIGPGATLYRGPKPAKALLIAFCGKAHRLGMPTPAFLQRVRARKWHVLMLRDLANSHYRRGCEGVAPDFPTLIRWLRIFAAGYERVVILGTSLGAGAAVRMSIGLGGVQVTAVGARPALDMDRMFKEPQPGLAFDPLCACLPKVERDITYVFGAKFHRDQKGAMTFQNATGGAFLPIPRLAQHGVMGPLWQSGQLGAFMTTFLSRRLTPAKRLRRWQRVVEKVIRLGS